MSDGSEKSLELLTDELVCGHVVCNAIDSDSSVGLASVAEARC